jgi:hypothetical protein
VISILVAVIGLVGTVTASLITAHAGRRAAPEFTAKVAAAQVPATIIQTDHAYALDRYSRALWWGVGSIMAWVIPLFGFPVCAIGMVIAIRELTRGPRRRGTVPGLVLCCIFLVATIINSAIGAYQGGTMYA